MKTGPAVIASLVFGAVSFAAWIREPVRVPMPRAWECGEILGRLPGALNARNEKIWIVERSPDIAVYYVELMRKSPLAFHNQATVRVFVLSGRMKLRMSFEEKMLGPGSFAVIPLETMHRITRAGREKLIYAAIYTPDVRSRSLFENPNIDIE